MHIREYLQIFIKSVKSPINSYSHEPWASSGRLLLMPLSFLDVKKGVGGCEGKMKMKLENGRRLI